MENERILLVITCTLSCFSRVLWDVFRADRECYNKIMRKVNLEKITQSVVAVLASISVPLFPLLLLLIDPFHLAPIIAATASILLLFPLWVFVVIKGTLYKTKTAKTITILLLCCSLVFYAIAITDGINYYMRWH